jgi:nitrogen regulatory protein PII
MKLIWALIPFQSTKQVVDALTKIGIHAITCIGVNGSSPEPGSTARPSGPVESLQEMLMIALADHDVAKAVIVIRTVVKTSLRDTFDGTNPAEGKIFVTYVEDFYTIRTGQKTLGTHAA